MFRIVCKSKIEGAVVTKIDLHYGGSIGIDKDILQRCDLFANEVVHVLNQNNGKRFETYIIEEGSGSGVIALYGPAARLGEVGDKLYILGQGIIRDEDIQQHKINVVSLKENNTIRNK